MNAVDVATNAKQWYRKMSVRGTFCGRNARSDKDMLAHDRWKRRGNGLEMFDGGKKKSCGHLEKALNEK